MSVTISPEETQTISPLATTAQQKQHAYDNKIPPELHGALAIVGGRSNGFAGMPLADQVAALHTAQQLEEMRQLLIEQGETPEQVNTSLLNHAKSHMGLEKMDQKNMDALLRGTRNGLNTNETGDALVLDPYKAEENRQRITEAYLQGKINQQINNPEQVTSMEEVAEFARKHGLSQDVLETKLAEKGVKVEEKNPVQEVMSQPAFKMAGTAMTMNYLTGGV